MFDRVARRYDLLNDLMSFGQHRRWRKLAAGLVGPLRGRVLDLATGTGDFALELAGTSGVEVIAVDFSASMLEAARAKLATAALGSQVRLVLADALALPFPDGAFDGLTSAFLLRNLADLDAGLREMRRVVNSQGWVVALDITSPDHSPLGTLSRWYFQAAAPMLGGLVSGEWSAYRYLPASVDPLPPPPDLSSHFRAAGFTNVRFVRLALGMVAVHLARV